MTSPLDSTIYIACHGCRRWKAIHHVDDTLLPPSWVRRDGRQLCPQCQVTP